MDEIRCLIELRADDTRQSPGRISGRLIRYGERASDRPERFARGALTWPTEGVILNEQHNRQAPILRFVPEIDGDDVRIDAALPDTQRGRDAATLIRNGTMTGLSIEFRAVQERQAGGIREVRAARLVAAALVDSGAYGASTVELRHRDRRKRRRAWL